MTEPILLLVIVSLVVLIAYLDWNNRKERKTMLNAIMAKNTQDLVSLNLADKTEIKTQTPNENKSDFVDASNVPDNEYIDMITGKE